MSNNEKTALHIVAHGATQWLGHQASKDRDGTSKTIGFIIALVVGLFLSWLIEKL
jgi:hypothetical protein